MNKKVYVSKNKFGKGVFAKKGILKGENILKFHGSLINFREATAKGDKKGNPLQIKENVYFDTEPPGVFVNHSCNPNAGIKDDIKLIALKEIKKDEEVYYDYSTTMDEDDWEMECGCQATNCRKVIRDFKFLPTDLRKKYLELEIVQEFISKKEKKVILEL